MKKFIILMLVFASLTGCTQSEFEEEKEIYKNYARKLENADDKDFNNKLPFDVKVYFQQIVEGEIIYRVIIDNPRKIARNIKVMAIHDYETNDIFPTSGIFDEPLSLIPNVVNLGSNYVKGIVLVGYIDTAKPLENFDAEVRLLIVYEDENDLPQEVLFKHRK